MEKRDSLRRSKLMTTFKFFIAHFLFAAILGGGAGCATLPDVSAVIDEAPTAQKPRQIVSSKGEISPQKSTAVMERLSGR